MWMNIKKRTGASTFAVGGFSDSTTSDYSNSASSVVSSQAFSSNCSRDKTATTGSDSSLSSCTSGSRSSWADMMESDSDDLSEASFAPMDQAQTLRSISPAALPRPQSTSAPCVSKERKRQDIKHRPPKRKRMQAKQLALMLFEANTDEDREVAEIAFMDATENDPLVYDAAMSVLQCLRSTWRSNLAV